MNKNDKLAKKSIIDIKAINSTTIATMQADITGLQGDAEIVYNYIDMKYPDTYGLGLYSSWVHLDVRQDKGRWNG